MFNVDDRIESVRGLIEAWNSHDLNRIGAFFHAEFENHQIPFPPVIGLEAYLNHCQHWFTAFPDFTIKELTLFAQDNLVCLETLGQGTRIDDFFGIGGSSREEFVHACDILEFRGERILRERGFWDFSIATGSIAPSASPADASGQPLRGQ